MFARWLNLPRNGLEISDAIVSFDPETLARRPVLKSEVVGYFAALGNRAAVGIIEKIPAQNDVLDAAAVDRLLVTAHCEMQRISEEFQHGRRVAELLKPLLATLRGAGGLQRKIRIVDIGCGTGFVLRWLAANRSLENVELVGVDFNSALVAEANRLAAAENLDCRFLAANAFRMNEPADIYLSTGILHHFRGESLADLFRQQNRSGTSAFLHFDFKHSPLAPFGSWLFHAVRMRTPLAKHDGVLSAVRSYKCHELLDAARRAAPDFAVAVYGVRLWGTPLPRVFHSLTGIRRELHDEFLKNLGRRRIAALGVIE